MSQDTLVGTRFIRALSDRQPWASLIAEKFKTIEQRSWMTKYRGLLLIVASKTKPDWSDVLFDLNPDAEKLREQALPLGQAVAITNLTDCRPMTTQDEEAAMCEAYEGAKAWVLTDTRKIAPFPVKGQLGIFTVEIPRGRFS